MRGTSWADAVEDTTVCGGAADCGGEASGGGTGRSLEPKRWTQAQKKAAKEQD
jgi:hypothetical protein